MIHTNFLAYDDHECFTSKDDIDSYRLEKLKGVQKNIDFVKEHFKNPINVLEIGSGNSKFLYSLYLEGLLQNGYGVEISKRRFDFANKWKEQIKAHSVVNFNENALEFDLSKIPKIDLVYCVDLAFQFFEPTKKQSDIHLLSNYYDRLVDGGKLILELDCYDRLISGMKDNHIKTWQEFDEPDPWMYLLWECDYNTSKDHLRIDKTFIKRNLTEVSKSEVIFKNYERHDIIDILKKIGFKDVKIYENWQSYDDTLDDEFIVVATK